MPEVTEQIKVKGYDYRLDLLPLMRVEGLQTLARRIDRTVHIHTSGHLEIGDCAPYWSLNNTTILYNIADGDYQVVGTDDAGYDMDRMVHTVGNQPEPTPTYRYDGIADARGLMDWVNAQQDWDMKDYYCLFGPGTRDGDIYLKPEGSQRVGDGELVRVGYYVTIRDGKPVARSTRN